MYGIRIKTARKNKKLTQLEFANLLGCSASSIALYENEKREPDFSLLLKMSSILGVSTDYLLGNDEVLNKEIEIALSNQDKKLNQEQVANVLQYIDFLKSQNN